MADFKDVRKDSVIAVEADSIDDRERKLNSYKDQWFVTACDQGRYFEWMDKSGVLFLKATTRCGYAIGQEAGDKTSVTVSFERDGPAMVGETKNAEDAEKMAGALKVWCEFYSKPDAPN